MAPLARSAPGHPPSPDRARAALRTRLESRRTEIEQAALTRVYAISDPADVADPEYTEGLRTAVSAALDYGLATVERGEQGAPPIPPVLLSQARIAARSGVSLDTVLRRYFAGYTLLGDFLIEEAEQHGALGGTALKSLLRAQAALFDRVLAAVSEEHRREGESRIDTTEQRRAERVKRLLEGELVDTSELNYELDACHLGVIGAGPTAAETMREIASRLDRRLLLVRQPRGIVWAWLGSRRRLDPTELELFAAASKPAQLVLAIGEPGHGLGGWRFTHRQARAALPIALRGDASHVRYADVALRASILHDEILTTSLRELYLVPLEAEKDGGLALRETLRAYFAAGRNASSAASALGVSRQTIGSRLRTVEERIGRNLDGCATEIEIALQMDGRHHV